MSGSDRAGMPGEGLPGRVLTRLTSPAIYLAVIGGLQAILLWEGRSLYGEVLALAFAALLAVLIAAIIVRRGAWRLKLAAVSLLALLSAGVPTVIGMVRRVQLGITIEHDGLLQIESAIDRLLHGQAIYGVDWSATPMARLPWGLPGGNPALHHLAYYPLTILVGVPFRLASDAIHVPFDYRMVLLVFAALGLAGVLCLPMASPARLMLICAVFLNPLITLYLWTGRNDIEFVAMLLVTLALLTRRRVVLAGLTLGIAVALKPFAWPAIPFFLLVLWLRRHDQRHSIEWMSSLAAVAAVPLITVLPFLLANAHAFWTDTVLYTSGGVKDAYPIGGYGFGALLLMSGAIKHSTDAFPFGLLQLAAAIPVLYLTARSFIQRPTLSRWLAGYALVLLALTFFARFFNDNYVGVVVALLVSARPLGDRSLLGPASMRTVVEPVAA